MLGRRGGAGRARALKLHRDSAFSFVFVYFVYFINRRIIFHKSLSPKPPYEPSRFGLIPLARPE